MKNYLTQILKLLKKTMAKKTNQKPDNSTVEIELAIISGNPLNPRKRFPENELGELAESIKSIGLIQPITVRPLADGFQVICGERRFRAAQLIQAEKITCIVKDLDDIAALEFMISENLQRQDVNPLEEAEAFDMMLNKMNYNETDIAVKIGKTEKFVRRRLKLLNLIPELKEELYKGELPYGHAELLSIISIEDQTLWLNDVYLKIWSNVPQGAGTLAELKEWINDEIEKELSKAKFDINKEFVGEGFIKSSCIGCQYNSATPNNLFPDNANAAICYHGKCFAAKENSAYKIKLDAALADPEISIAEVNYNYSHQSLALSLKKDGIEVIKRNYAQKIEVPEKPELPIKSTEEFCEEMEMSEKQNEEAYLDAMEDYKYELAQYERLLEIYNENKDKGRKVFDLATGTIMEIIVSENHGNKPNLSAKTSVNPFIAKYEAQINKIEKQLPSDELRLDLELNGEILKRLENFSLKSMPLSNTMEAAFWTFVFANFNDDARDNLCKILNIKTNIYNSREYEQAVFLKFKDYLLTITHDAKIQLYGIAIKDYFINRNSNSAILEGIFIDLDFSNTEVLFNDNKNKKEELASKASFDIAKLNTKINLIKIPVVKEVSEKKVKTIKGIADLVGDDQPAPAAKPKVKRSKPEVVKG